MTSAVNQPASTLAWSTLIRSTAISGITGALTGVVVGGVGGRIVMRISALVAGDCARGAITDNGDRVGELTIEGTIELLANGLIFGVVGGVVWIVSEPWLRRCGPRVGLSFGILLFALAGTETIVADNRDFAILDPAWFNVLLFGLLFFAYGSLFPILRRLNDRMLPGRVKTTTAQNVLYGFVLVLGVPFLVITFAALFADALCLTCGPSQRLPGIAFTGMAVATALLRWKQLHQDPLAHDRRLVIFGVLSLAAAVVLGLIVTIPEIADII
jgi:hypothetical protein